MAPAAQAGLWTLDNSMEVRLQSNDNYELTPPGLGGIGPVATLALTDSFSAARQTERSATRVDGALTGLLLRGGIHQGQADGRLAIAQQLSTERDHWNLGLNFVQDTTLDATLSGTDLLLGQGRRRSSIASAGWTHQLDERLSVQARTSWSRTDYAQELTQAEDYASADFAGSAQYQLDERDALTLQLDHSPYHTLSGSARSTTDSLGLGGSRELSERAQLSVNLGAYETRVSNLLQTLACPLQAIFCQAGLLPYVEVPLTLGSTARGLQYSAAYRWQFDERTSINLTAGRQTLPTGAGAVARTDTLSAAFSHAFTPELSLDASYVRTHAAFDGVTPDAQPTLQTLKVTLSHALTPSLNLRLEGQRLESAFAGPTPAAHQDLITVALKLDWPRSAPSH